MPQIERTGKDQMSRFYASIQGQAGEATRTGGANSGIRGHVRGWNLGVKVDGYQATREDAERRDAFEVHITGGSNGGRFITLGDVEEHPSGDGSIAVTLGEAFGGGRFVISADGIVFAPGELFKAVDWSAANPS